MIAGGGWISHGENAVSAKAAQLVPSPRGPWNGWTGLPTTTQPPAPPSPSSAVARSEPSGRARVPSPRPRSALTGDPWGCIRKYESGGTTDPAGANLPGGGYYQFEDSTWHAAGGTGHASDHSYEEQTARAQSWQAKHGWGQWSTAKRCGLA